MKLLFIMVLSVCSSTALAQPKFYDYSYIGKKGGICVYSTAEKKEYFITQGSAPCISPDGRKLAYTDLDNKGRRFIAVIDLNTKKKTIFNTHSTNSFGPVWSPDGKFIAYDVWNEQKSDWSVAVIDSGNTKPVVISGKIKGVFMPSWCGHGKNIAGHDMDNLYIFNLSGTLIQTIALKQNHLTTDIGMTSADSFIFINDDKKLVYTTSVDEPGEDVGPPSAVFVYNFATKQKVRLSPKGYDLGVIAVNGNNILFTGSKINATVLNTYTVGMDGNGLKLLFQGCTNTTAKN